MAAEQLVSHYLCPIHACKMLTSWGSWAGGGGGGKVGCVWKNDEGPDPESSEPLEPDSPSVFRSGDTVVNGIGVFTTSGCCWMKKGRNDWLIFDEQVMNDSWTRSISLGEEQSNSFHFNSSITGSSRKAYFHHNMTNRGKISIKHVSLLIISFCVFSAS